jgi:hypothetical protein
MLLIIFFFVLLTDATIRSQYTKSISDPNIPNNFRNNYGPIFNSSNGNGNTYNYNYNYNNNLNNLNLNGSTIVINNFYYSCNCCECHK